MLFDFTRFPIFDPGSGYFPKAKSAVTPVAALFLSIPLSFFYFTPI